MFPLRIELLFANMEWAKAAARKLNAARLPRRPAVDPREAYRMQREIGEARERIREKVARARFLP